MSYSGGEILRAVLDQNAVYANPAFYCITLNAVNGTGAATATQRGFLQLHKDRGFLTTSVIPTGTKQGGFERIDATNFITLFDPQNNDRFALTPSQMQGSLYSESALAFAQTLPEYIYWEPGSLIGLEWTGPNYVDTIEYKFLTLVGIEYGFQGL